jgi:excisionase family DNA binding protein
MIMDARMPPTVDIYGAAELMKIHPKTVLDKIGSGELPAARVGRAYVLLTSDVLAHIQQAIARQTAERLGAPARHQRRAAKSLPRRLA